MTWLLYVREDCHDCGLVRDWMDEHGIIYDVRDIDSPGSHKGQRLFIAPALCRGTELVAYGVDILAFLERTPH